jgi:predicted transcriptional regulator of viral defense system
MSTLKNNLPAQRMMILARSGMPLWHTREIGIAWNISNPNTLRTTLKRYNANKLLYRLYRGFYSTIPIEKLDPWLIGVRALQTYSYISIETILFKYGIINQPPSGITLISSVSKHFSIATHTFLVRKMRAGNLYNNIGIIKENNINIATPERAVADMLYYNPQKTFDTPNLINWSKVKKIISHLKNNDKYSS